MISLLGHRPSRCVRRFAATLGAAMLVAVALGFAADVSEASCGDWLEGHAVAGDAAEASHGVPQPATPRPCSGPSCGRGPAPMPFAPGEAPVAPLDLDQHAILPLGSDDDALGVAAAVAIERCLLPTTFSGRPERPPRGG